MARSAPVLAQSSENGLRPVWLLRHKAALATELVARLGRRLHRRLAHGLERNDLCFDSHRHALAPLADLARAAVRIGLAFLIWLVHDLVSA
jgi:hypothetical protein